MDQATIDAMRAVVDMIDKMVKRSDGYGRDIVNTLDGEMAVSTLRAAVEGLRELVERAAAERAEPMDVAAGQSALRRVLNALKDAANAAVANGRNGVRLYVTDANYTAVPRSTVAAAVGAIETLLAAKPAPPTKPAEPTLEECVAAINRHPEATHFTDFKIRIVGVGLATKASISPKEVRAMGRLLIERERDEAAKGGA